MAFITNQNKDGATILAKRLDIRKTRDTRRGGRAPYKVKFSFCKK